MAGTTSRTLRHYDDIGLVPPTQVGGNGYRYYDQTALTRLQRVLLLRELGLGLSQIGEVLDGSRDDANALVTHAQWIRQERARLGRQLASVESTIAALKEGEQIMAEEMLDGFDHTQYKQEVEERWGKQAYADSDKWYRGLTDSQRADFKRESTELAAAWIKVAAGGDAPDSEAAQAVAARHYAWLTQSWAGKTPTAAHLVGLGDMYVADERFAANYGGVEGATYVREALVAYTELSLR